MRSALARIWNTNPLGIIGAVLFAELAAVAFGYIPFSVFPTMALLMVLAYMQSTCSSLQGRSANRNSNAYHLVAAVVTNFVFFWSLRLLVTNDLPPVLLVPYVFATILGTLNGNSISIKIESALGLSPEGAKGRPQFLKLWPTVAVLFIVLLSQTIFLRGHAVLSPLPGNKLNTISLDAGILFTIFALTILSSFTFALLRVARSTDSYWFHFAAVIFNLAADFAKLAILIKFKMDWALFLPTTTGSVIGSLVGANLAQSVAAKINAKYDIHVLSKDEERSREASGAIPWPVYQLAALSVLVLPQTIFFGFASLAGGTILFFLAAWQALSFTMKSRAGQRNNQQYLAWASVFSNGVWYLTMHYLAQGNITLEKALPYIVGSAIGSLIGQLLSMKVERATGALMDVSVKIA